MVSSSERSRPPRAARMGSTSPMISAMVTSGVASFSTKRFSRGIQAIGGNSFAAGTADRLERIVVDFAAGDDGHLGVEEIDECTQDAALGLAAEAEKNEIVAREQ